MLDHQPYTARRSPFDRWFPQRKPSIIGNQDDTSASYSSFRSNSIGAQLLFWLTLLGAGSMLLWLSIARYMGYNAGMLDLGNMAQAIGSVQRGEPLVSTYGMGAMSRLALHVELIYFLIAPFYALWSDPRLLLIIQAGLFLLGAFPVYRLALRHGLSWPLAYCLTVMYLFYPVAVTSLLFDFHGDTLAMPLLLFAIDMLDRRAWRRYALFVVLVLSCKVYAAVPVALLGLMAWWCYGERRVAWLTIGTAVVYGLVAFLVIRPLFTTAQTPSAQRDLNYVFFYFNDLHEAFRTWHSRLFHAWVVFGPALLLSIFGWRWLLAALPVGIAVVLSNGPGPTYAYWFHHYALVVPFIIMAAITGSAWLAGGWRTMGTRSRRRWVATLMVVLTTLAVLYANRKYVDTPLNPKFWATAGLGLDAEAFGRTARDAVKDQFLAQRVPPEAPLAAAPFLGPHVTNRATLYPTRDLNDSKFSFAAILPTVNDVLTDALYDRRSAGATDAEHPIIARMVGDPAFALVAARDGLLLFQRNAPAGSRLVRQVAIEPAASGGATDAGQRFGPNIALLDVQITPQSAGRLRATFAWMLTGTSAPDGHVMAVSRLEGVAGARIIHLPTYVMLPVSRWKPGQVVRETFDVELPATLPAGRYTWRTGWYDLSQRSAYLTDQRSLLPGSQELAVATVDVPAH